MMYIAQKLERFPNLKRRLSALRRKLRHIQLRIRSYSSRNVSCDKKVIWLSPNRILYTHKKIPSLHENRDTVLVLHGNWDLPKYRVSFESIDCYDAFRQRILNHKEWGQTPFYKRILDEILNGEIKWGCSTKEQLDDRCKKLDQLYYDIQKNGYRSQEELIRNGAGYLNKFDEIEVSIGRNGEFLFTNGQHRLSIAKILGLKEVPVVVVAVHSEWVNSYNKNFKNGGKVQGGSTEDIATTAVQLITKKHVEK